MIGIPLPNILDGWASHTGRCEGATAEKAVPFPSDRPSILLPQQINPGGHHCMSSEHFGQLAWQFKRMSGSSGLKVQAAIAC
jgi:hypothetical protein